MVNSSLVAPESTGIISRMDVYGSELTLREEIAQETRKLCASGVPEFLASIQAAVAVSKRRAVQDARREEAMLSHCNEP